MDILSNKQPNIWVLNLPPHLAMRLKKSLANHRDSTLKSNGNLGSINTFPENIMNSQIGG